MTEDVERVCEISRRGRLVTAEPWFDHGVPVAVESRSARGLADGDLALLVLPARGRARVVEEIGHSSEIESVLEGLLLERGARWPDESSARAASEARQSATEPTDHTGRADLRALPTITIDPESARDYDDAISVSETPVGWQVWIHIADVSAYVPADGKLDRWAKARAFSTYVPGRVSPMLPEPLSAGACSLVPHRDRWCVSVEATVQTSGEVSDPTMYRSVIRSDARLTYSEAEQIARGASAHISEALASLVGAATALSEHLRSRRFSRGALRLERPELVIELDGQGGVDSARWDDEPSSHALIEELMILANEVVGGFLAQTRTDALFRIHPDPDPQAIIGLIARLAALDVPTPPQPEQLTPRGAADLAAAIAEKVAEHARGRSGGEALSSLVLRSLEQATYSPVNRGHAGLASPAYSHFTSPIRRYPDLVVHRALLARLGLADSVGVPDLESLGVHCSERERELAKVEHEANDICLAWLLDRLLYEEGWETEFDGEIIGLIASGLFLRFGEVFEGYLPARALQDDYYELDELGVSLVGRRNGRRFRLGDHTRVRVDTLDRANGKTKLALSGKNDRR